MPRPEETTALPRDSRQENAKTCAVKAAYARRAAGTVGNKKADKDGSSVRPLTGRFAVDRRRWGVLQYIPSLDSRAQASNSMLLVVDDNRDAADTLAGWLRLEGYEVAVAYGGREALAAALARPPALMLVDLDMPDLDGLALAREIRLHPELAQIRLVVLSGFADPAHQLEADSAGFIYYLVKASDPDRLRQLIRRALTPAAQDGSF
jgi:CheY-like chemotaxis protein